MVVLAAACSGSPKQVVLTADMPLHLEDHLDAATVEGSTIPTPTPAPVEWRFDQPQPDWKPLRPNAATRPVPKTTRIERTNDALRVTLSDGLRQAGESFHGGIYIDLPTWRREEWADIVVRARTTASGGSMAIGMNLPPAGRIAANAMQANSQRTGGTASLVADGSVQTYQISPSWGNARAGPWQRVGLEFTASEPASIDLLSVSVNPIDAAYTDAPHGVRDIDREGVLRPVVFTHASSRLGWRIQVPAGGRLSVALSTLDRRAPVAFSVALRSTAGDESIFREVVQDTGTWQERAIELSEYAGRTLDLVLSTESERPGQIGLWGSPIVSGRATASRSAARRRPPPPNVILYVIDQGGADFMSLHGYNRRTTPNLERLAAEAVVFDRAHSNSAWTKPSTASFMTSLQHSALGGFRGSGDQVPETAPTMAQRFHEAGYQTGVFTHNPNAGRSSALNRGVDRFQDDRRPGRSLVPLMRGDPRWEIRPVILEQVERDVRTNEFTGHIEMTDGRWGASLEIWPQRRTGDPPVQPSRWRVKARFHADGQPRLLLYDLWEDPFTRQNVNDRHPELVEKYTRLLADQWQVHQAFAEQFKPGGQVALTPEQLEQLRSLGYIR